MLPSADRSTLQQLLQAAILETDEPFTLSSGHTSRYFLDGKAALAQGNDLALACRLLHQNLTEAGIDYDAIGGLTLGADQFAHGVAIVADRAWFVVRKQPKGRGTDRYVEGASVADKRVVLVDDVISTGASTLVACDRVQAEGATVVGATTLVARSAEPAARFAARGIPFHPLFTHADLGLPAIGEESS